MADYGEELNDQAAFSCHCLDLMQVGEQRVEVWVSDQIQHRRTKKLTDWMIPLIGKFNLVWSCLTLFTEPNIIQVQPG